MRKSQEKEGVEIMIPGICVAETSISMMKCASQIDITVQEHFVLRNTNFTQNLLKGSQKAIPL